MKQLVALMMCAVSLYATAQIFDESDIFYQSDFSQNDFEGWSKSQTIQYDNRTLLGNFGNETCSLTLVCMPPHTGLQLSFDLYALDTWDGNGTASGGNDPDLWFCSIDGGTLIETTFGHASNNPQSYPDNYPSNNPPFAGAVQQSLGYFCYGQNGTTAQYSLSFTVEHSVASAEIIFGADLLQDLCDESWALGNVVVSLNGSSAAMGCTDILACNFNIEAECDDGSCDYTCCPGPGCCLDGQHWDWELNGCVITNPADINFDGCVQLNDLLDLLSAYGMCFVWQCGDLIEYQGYDYETVQIGEQCWFAENLRAEYYQNNDPLASDLSDEEWSSISIGAQSFYEYNSEILADYGRLYNGYAVLDEREICPSGWHVPTDNEFMALEVHLGMSPSEVNSSGWRGTNEGEKLKSSPSDDPAWNGNNASGFGAAAGGMRFGTFYYQGAIGSFWTAEGIYCRELHGNDQIFRDPNNNLIDGFSVRCIKDAE